MKLTFLLTLCISILSSGQSQGIKLLYKGGGLASWNDPVNWIQINAPTGQTPIQRVPTELDDVVFSSAQSGLTAVVINFDLYAQHFIVVGGDSTNGYRCRSMHVSNTDLSLQVDLINPFFLDVYTGKGGFVIIDSGSNFEYGHFQLHGGNPNLNDLEIINSSFGSLFSHNDWSGINLDTMGRARLVNSTLGGQGVVSGGGANAELYAESCKFITSDFSVADNSTATIVNCQIENDVNNVALTFLIGRNAHFVSSNFNLTTFSILHFTTSGSVLNGDVTCLYAGGSFSFDQEDPLQPLPNIINGNLTVSENNEFPISGDVKISGDFINHSFPEDYYVDTAQIVINNKNIFMIGGLPNYGKTDSIVGCAQNYCHFNMEFFGETNSNIFWPIGLPVDTLVINKSGCAKVAFTNSLYVSGQAKIKSGQLVLNPNDTIPYKFVCAGDVNIYDGGGIFLRRDSSGVIANMAVAGAIHDYNQVIDSTCNGLSNPYNGNITLYGKAQDVGDHLISIASASSIGDLNLIGQLGSDFRLGGNLVVNNLNFITPGKLLLGDHDLTVNGDILNYGMNNYFVTNGTGYLQINNIGNASRVFPVGTSSSSYTPATIANPGTVDNFRLKVRPQVLSGGNTGNPYIAGVVNKAWDIIKTTAGAANANLTLQWNADDELTNFTRNTSYLSHYTTGSWDEEALTAAGGSNPYTITRTGITSFSPFAVLSPSGVVPIDVPDFSGRYHNKAIELNWITQTESNINYFTIEKSSDAVLFRPLASIPAFGNSQAKRNYDYVDHSDVSYINYYRLKMVDITGKFLYTKTIKISAAANHLAAIFPNPVKDKLFIRLRDALPGSAIRIIDTRGNIVRALQSKRGVTGVSVNTNNMSAGVYSIIIHCDKLKETLQFVKE